jgi:N-acetylmuramoyl-L-alanine amidase CwlA
MTTKQLADKLGLNYEERRLGYHLTNNPNRLMKDGIKFVTVHQTDNTSIGANADKHHKYLANNSGGEKTSWHWSVDELQAIQSFRDDRVTWHAPGGNEMSIGIELCVDDDAPGGIAFMSEENYKKTLDNGAKLVAVKLVEYGLTPADVRQHHDWSGKDCPQYIRAGKYGITWGDFLTSVRKYYEILTKPEEAPVKVTLVPDGKLYQVAVGAYKDKQNALEQVEKAKAAGLNAYLVLINDPRRA